MQPTSAGLPIGYWIEKGDELLTRHINNTHQLAGLSRVGWQLLHTICTQTPQTAVSLAKIVTLFATESEVDELLASLADRGYLFLNREEDDSVTATSAGEQLHKSCLAQQTKIRQPAVQDISEEQYMVTIQTLQKMVSNLEQRN